MIVAMGIQREIADEVLAANALTRQWACKLDGLQNSVISGTGVWLLLVALMAAADDETGGELAAATGVARPEAIYSFSHTFDHVRQIPGVGAAVGMWANVDLREDFVSSISATIDRLPATREPLDKWARDNTSGLVDKFPGNITPDSRFVIASALAAQADWVQPFDQGIGRWHGQPKWLRWLYGSGTDLDLAAIVSNEFRSISRVVCKTVSGFDVHLVAGSLEETPEQVISLAVDAIVGDAETVTGSGLRAGDKGGCLVVESVAALNKTPQLNVSVPVFEVDSVHDLLANKALFGLIAAQDSLRGHFPALSSFPLAVQSATQVAMAGFSATGFKAAAVSGVAMMVGGGPPPKKATSVTVAFDRPFGFLVVDRATGLVLFAGWIVQPVQPEIEYLSL
jgi:Serpin (serine protease inhibitor)